MPSTNPNATPHLDNRPLGPLSQWLRRIVEVVGSLVLGRPAKIVPKQAMDRLYQLERREELKSAERRGDEEFLDRELAKSELTEEEYRRATRGTTPIATWPDEDFSDLLQKKDEGKRS
jgi:hypothetical protein